MKMILFFIRIWRKLNFVYYGVLYGLILKKKDGKLRMTTPLLVTPQFMECGKNILIHKNARIEGVSFYQGEHFNPVIILKDGVSIQQNIHLTCANKIVIMEMVAIGANVTITDINHPYDDVNIAIEDQKIKVSEVYIGKHSKLYNNCVILPGVKLGKHTVVGANSVVKSGTYPDYCVLVGSPAKIVKQYDNVIKTWTNNAIE